MSASTVFGQCAQGCLACTPANTCAFCDITNNYYLSTSKCASIALPNCLQISTNGSCLQCKDSHYYSATSQGCAPVSSSLAVANCLSYSSIQVCLSCKGGFILKNGKCQQIGSVVLNCEVH